MKKKVKKVKQSSPLPILAGAVLIAAVLVTLAPKLFRENDAGLPENPPADSSGLVIQTAEIDAAASYFDYDADGATVQIFAVRASDDTVRLALNTCQVCNGSPYAYFEQEGDGFVCQNCGNYFASDAVGLESGGCNPVPITEEVYTEENGALTIPASFLEDNAYRFKTWKQF